MSSNPYHDATAGPPATPRHENVAALLRRQQSTTARLRAGLPALLAELEELEILDPAPAPPPDPPSR